MKAAILEGERTIIVKDVKIDFPEDWVKIKIESAGICGSDINFWFGNSLDTVKGKILGHEVSGIIVELPKDYKGKFKIGDGVVIEPLIGCGKCEYCRSGKYYLCNKLKHIGIFYPGGFAEVTAAPPEKIFSLPLNLSYDLGSLADVVAVAVHCGNILKTVEKGKNLNVCIVGDGPIALSTVVVLRKFKNVNKISLIGKHARNMELSRKMGVTVMERITGNYDIVIEAVGRRRGTSAFDTSIKLVKPGSVLIVLGQYHDRFYELDLHRLVNEELKLIGSFSYGIFDGKRELELALSVISEFKDYFESMITHRIKLEKISKAFEIAANKDEYKSIKVIVKPNMKEDWI